ncbi:hypothetical protein KSF81_12105 [Siccirubricoccus sp. G192]|nr:hypothetical protein [Siccirubricoccus sp. G192]MBV1797738.1 hypothetical protein [Siccirubricoccus sp. G192]
MQANIGGDARQDLVGGDQHAAFRAVEAGHVGGMAGAGHHHPFGAADAGGAAVLDGMEGARQSAHRPLVERAAALDEGKVFGGAAGAGVMGDLLRHHVRPGIIPEGAGRQPFDPGHPWQDAEPFAEPAGEADMVGVEMRDQQRGERPAPQFRLRQHLVPQGARGAAGDGGIDRQPAAIMLQ